MGVRTISPCACNGIGREDIQYECEIQDVTRVEVAVPISPAIVAGESDSVVQAELDELPETSAESKLPYIREMVIK